MFSKDGELLCHTGELWLARVLHRAVRWPAIYAVSLQFQDLVSWHACTPSKSSCCRLLLLLCRPAQAGVVPEEGAGREGGDRTGACMVNGEAPLHPRQASLSSVWCGFPIAQLTHSLPARLILPRCATTRSACGSRSSTRRATSRQAPAVRVLDAGAGGTECRCGGLFRLWHFNVCL